MTPAPPDAPPPGAVCGDGVASVDALYACAAGGRLSGASLGGDSEEADQCVEGAAPRARRVERVGGTSNLACSSIRGDIAARRVRCTVQAHALDVCKT